MAISTKSAADTEPANRVHLKLAATADINSSGSRQEHHSDLDSLSSTTSQSNGRHRFFKSATWSPDGTSVITNSDDNHISTYVIPPDLLADHPSPLTLTPYATIPSHNTVPTLTPYPHFTLTDPTTTLLLSSCHQHPIRLHNVCSPHTQIASYPLISPHNEAYITPSSLLFQPDGTEFIAGADTSIATFDISRPGEDPVMWYRTGPKRSRDTSWRNPATSVKGIISTMALDRSKLYAGARNGVLAVGTFARQIGLYDAAGKGECIAAFSVKGTEGEEKGGYRGTGLTQVLWSSCGRYLFAVERKSDGVLVYDIRVSGKVCGYLSGRNAITNQRMSVDVVERGGRTELWAGGVDGVVRCWHDPQSGWPGEGGGLAPSREKTVHRSAVNAVGVHPEENVLLTASGERAFVDFDDDEESRSSLNIGGGESMIKLWDMAAKESALES